MTTTLLDERAAERLTRLSEQVTLFAIISTPRAGSTLLCGLLDSHPQVICHYELFHPNEVALSFRFEERMRDTSVRDVGALPFLGRLFYHQHRQNPSFKALGFKLQLSPFQIDAALEEVASCRAIKKILLDRTNRLALVASGWLASTTGLWQTTTPQPFEKGLVHFNAEAFVTFQERVDADMAKVERLVRDQDVLRLDYTDLLQPAAQAGMFDFLGIDAAPLRTDWVKTGTGSPLDVFDNPEEVIACMEHLGHPEWLMDRQR